MPSNPTTPASAARTLIAHNRLEPRARSQEFNRSLRAEVRDAAWLLARQWQLKEFRAEDRGSPARAELTMRTAQPTQLQLGANPAQAYDPLRPWEAQVQAQPPAVDAGLRLRMGQAWLRLLRENNLAGLAAAFRTRFPLAAVAEAATGGYDLAYAQAETTSEVQEILRALGGAALDGYALFQALQADVTAASTGPGAPVDAPTQTRLNELAGSFRDTYRRLYFGRPATSAWSVPELSYQFALAMPDAAAQPPVVLAGQAHTGGQLAWYALDEAPAANYPALSGLGGGIAPRPPQSVLPTELEFAGSPSSRWWNFEDHRVDFGQVSGDASDFGRMLLQEFVFLFQNDWFSVPYTVPVGSLNTLTSLLVTDVFGYRYRVHPAGASPLTEPDGTRLDDDRGRWSLFGHSAPGQRTAPVPRVLVPHPALNPLVGRPVEQVVFTREEASNLVWAVEQTIPDGLGGGTDGAGAAARIAEYLRARATPAPPAAAAYTYQLESAVPEYWIPFVARPDPAGTAYLEQGELPRVVAGQLPLRAADRTVQPRSYLLRLGAGSPGQTPPPYLVHEYQVPPTGTQVVGTYHRVRGLQGSVALWYEYERRPARRGGSSGLAFDQLLPGSAKSPDSLAPVLPYAQYQLFNPTGEEQYLFVPLPALPVLTVALWVNVADPGDFFASWHYLLDARFLRDDTYVANRSIGSAWTWFLDGVAQANSSLAATLPLGSWHHVVFTTGATQAGDLLVNARYSRNEYLKISRLADLRIYDRALSPAEMAAPAGLGSDGLVARFTFAPLGPRISPDTVQVLDVSGQGRPGTLQGF